MKLKLDAHYESPTESKHAIHINPGKHLVWKDILYKFI